MSIVVPIVPYALMREVAISTYEHEHSLRTTWGALNRVGR